MTNIVRRAALFFLGVGFLVLIVIAIAAASVEPLHERFNVWIEIVKALALVAAGFWAVHTRAFGLRERREQTRYEQIERLYSDFLSPDLLAKRRGVAKFWMTKLTFHGPHPTRVPSLKEVAPDALAEFARKNLGLTVVLPTAIELKNDPQLLADTEEVCNRFEHLGKLKAARAVAEEDIQLFFYSMIADSFVLFLPYIAYRRREKPSYAKLFQELVEVVPDLSRDVGSI